jgi:hypothetical protein
VEESNEEKGVLLFKIVRNLKVHRKLPEDALRKQLVSPKIKGAKVIFDGAKVGKTAVLFGLIEGLGRDPKPPMRLMDAAYVYIDNYWYLITYDYKRQNWIAATGEPSMLAFYCGAADKLRVSLKPDLVGKVPALSEDGKRVTLVPLATTKGTKPTPIEIKIGEGTRIVAIVKAANPKLRSARACGSGWKWVMRRSRRLSRSACRRARPMPASRDCPIGQQRHVPG